MVTVTEGKNARFYIDFAWEKDPHIRSFRLGLEEVFEGKYLETLYVPVQGQAFLLFLEMRQLVQDAIALSLGGLKALLQILKLAGRAFQLLLDSEDGVIHLLQFH